MLRDFAAVLLIGLRDYGTAQWEGGEAECDHSQKLGGNGSTSAKQMTSGGTQSYQHRSTCKKCGAIRIDGQIGLEATPDEYIAKLVDVFREVRRVLKGDGVLWVNIGDSYNSNSDMTRNDVKAAAGLREQPRKHRGVITAHKFKMKSGLSDKQVAYVLSELLKARTISEETQEARL